MTSAINVARQRHMLKASVGVSYDMLTINDSYYANQGVVHKHKCELVYVEFPGLWGVGPWGKKWYGHQTSQ
jgi:hypothetical protein